MAEITKKRLLTHKEIDAWLDKPLKFDMDVFNIFITVYYEVGTKPYDTGKMEIRGFLEDTETVEEAVLDDGRGVYDKNRKVLITELNFGEYLEKQLEKSKQGKRLTREHINKLWWEQLTKKNKSAIKKRLHGYMNQVGNIVLMQEHERLEEEKKNPPKTFAQAVEHLREQKEVEVSLDNVGKFDIWYEADEYQSGYISEYKGNILYNDPKIALQVTIKGMADEDEDTIKKIKYKLL